MKSKKILTLLLALIAIFNLTSITSFAKGQEYLGSFGQYYLDTQIYCGYLLPADTDDRMTIEADDYSPMPLLDDNRYELATPDPRVAFIKVEFSDGSTQGGTGFFISDRVLATSAHIVLGTDFELPVKIIVYPGLDDLPLYSDNYYTGESIVFPVSYFEPDDFKSDYALITTYETADVGYFGITTEHSEGSNVKTIGYPQEYLFHQYGCDGIIKQINPNHLMSDIVTSPGQSGSPLFDDNNLAHGILRGHDLDTNEAAFLKFDRINFTLFQRYINDPDYGPNH
ncbi:serine protease [Enterocloster aldenensis]|uniref:trypsin-like serine peptidase n=1 Tax=Enterocloster aldenensis TaxID=358742 RepID=UPI000E46E8E4|nr:serine protease [Enterocloster aldenensis]